MTSDRWHSRAIDGVSCFPLWSLSSVSAASAADGAMIAKAENSWVRIGVCVGRGCMGLIHNYVYTFATVNLAKVKSGK